MLIKDLILFHRRGSFQNPILSDKKTPWFEWKTCLRDLALGWKSYDFHLPDVDQLEIYEGQEAYQQLLEVICGLHSPLFGETEVLGQFREQTLKFKCGVEFSDMRFQKLFAKLLADAKVIRNRHLSGQGSQSYGSVVRREVRGIIDIHILGAGHLVREILPWITKEKHQVVVHARNVAKAQVELQDHRSVQVCSLYDSMPSCEAGGALLIAAPLSSEEILYHCRQKGIQPALSIDLRGESQQDPLQMSGRHLHLEEVFQAIEANREKQKEVKARALSDIKSLCAKRTREVECRPYGWEDLCAL